MSDLEKSLKRMKITLKTVEQLTTPGRGFTPTTRSWRVILSKNVGEEKALKLSFVMLSAKELSNNYLYKHIRVQGGAYGGMSSFDLSLGLFSFLSYRDTHIVETLQVFKDAQVFYSQNEIPSEEMEKAIISTIGMLDKPSDPAGRGHTALMRSFSGINDDMRQKFRNNILSATPRKLKDTLVDYFFQAAKSAAVAVYSSPEKLNDANTRLEEKLRIENIFEQ